MHSSSVLDVDRRSKPPSRSGSNGRAISMTEEKRSSTESSGGRKSWGKKGQYFNNQIEAKPKKISIQVTGPDEIGVSAHKDFRTSGFVNIMQELKAEFSGSNTKGWVLQATKYDLLLEKLKEHLQKLDPSKPELAKLSIEKIPRFVFDYLKPIEEQFLFMHNEQTFHISYASDAQDPDLSLDKLKPGILKKMYKFQTEAIMFGLKNHGRVLIADEMGVGKTVQALGLCALYHKEWPVLVVCPSSLKFNWLSETKRWLKEYLRESDLQVLERSGEKVREHAKFVIVSFDLAKKMAVELSKKHFKIAICDEAHYLKNFKSNRSVMLVPLIQFCKRIIMLPIDPHPNSSIGVFMLTGTPALSKPKELYPLLSCLRPDLYYDFHKFARRYCCAQGFSNFGGPDTEGAENLDELNYILKNVMIRRLKQEVLSELPSKIRQMVEIPTNGDKLASLATVMSQLNKELDSTLKSKEATLSRGEAILDALASTQRGIELAEKMIEAVEARPVSSSRGKLSGSSKLALQCFQLAAHAKVPGVLEFLSDLDHYNQKYSLLSLLNRFFCQKVVIFAHHQIMLDQLETWAITKKRLYIRIDGSVDAMKRGKLVEHFQKTPTCRYALMAITAANTGLTLSSASIVVFAELHWTPGQLVQAEDRCHRLTQKNHVICYYLVGKNTLDGQIYESLIHKTETIGKILDGEKAQALSMDQGSGSIKFDLMQRKTFDLADSPVKNTADQVQSNQPQADLSTSRTRVVESKSPAPGSKAQTSNEARECDETIPIKQTYPPVMPIETKTSTFGSSSTGNICQANSDPVSLKPAEIEQKSNQPSPSQPIHRTSVSKTELAVLPPQTTSSSEFVKFQEASTHEPPKLLRSVNSTSTTVIKPSSQLIDIVDLSSDEESQELGLLVTDSPILLAAINKPCDTDLAISATQGIMSSSVECLPEQQLTRPAVVSLTEKTPLPQTPPSASLDPEFQPPPINSGLLMPGTCAHSIEVLSTPTTLALPAQVGPSAPGPPHSFALDRIAQFLNELEQQEIIHSRTLVSSSPTLAAPRCPDFSQSLPPRTADISFLCSSEDEDYLVPRRRLKRSRLEEELSVIIEGGGAEEEELDGRESRKGAAKSAALGKRGQVSRTAQKTQAKTKIIETRHSKAHQTVSAQKVTSTAGIKTKLSKSIMNLKVSGLTVNSCSELSDSASESLNLSRKTARKSNHGKKQAKYSGSQLKHAAPEPKSKFVPEVPKLDTSGGIRTRAQNKVGPKLISQTSVKATPSQRREELEKELQPKKNIKDSGRKSQMMSEIEDPVTRLQEVNGKLASEKAQSQQKTLESFFSTTKASNTSQIIADCDQQTLKSFKSQANCKSDAGRTTNQPGILGKRRPLHLEDPDEVCCVDNSKPVTSPKPANPVKNMDNKEKSQANAKPSRLNLENKQSGETITHAVLQIPDVDQISETERDSQLASKPTKPELTTAKSP